jgi:hypothetical protein
MESRVPSPAAGAVERNGVASLAGATFWAWSQRIMVIPGDLQNSVTPLWQQILAGLFFATVMAMACVSWLSFFRIQRPFRRNEKFFLAGLVILTIHIMFGAVFFFVPAWVIPQHDRLGVDWFFASPGIMLIVLIMGSAAWRAFGKPLVFAALAGISLWLLIFSTLII